MWGKGNDYIQFIWTLECKLKPLAFIAGVGRREVREGKTQFRLTAEIAPPLRPASDILIFHSVRKSRFHSQMRVV